MPDKSVILKALKEDSLELIQKLNSGLLIVEKDPNQKETWEDIMRSLHNLKGLARVMGFEDIGTLSHRMEDIVKLITEKKVPFSPQMVDTLLRGVDSIDYLLKAAIDDHEVDFNLPQMLSQLEAAARGEQVKVKTDKKDTKKEVGEEKPSVTATPQASGIQESIRVRTEKLDYLLNLSSEMIIDRICLNKEIKDMENIQDMLYREIQEWQRFSREWRAFNRTMDKTKINDFNEWFGRNIQNSLSIKEKFDNLFYTHSQTISHHSMSVTDLQHRITEIRMLPISILISTFPRMVRDLSHQFKKEIDLVMEGSEIEVDKKILEELRDPLIHILRNSIDHGIEEPAERTKKGKSALGNIKISVKYQGNRLRIEFSDNGRGIDIEKIKKKAVKKGLYKEKDIESLEREDLLNLIFKPGFSTSEIVTSLSGRGVGMDVVQKNIKAMNGSISVETEKDKGTKISLLLPLSLATTNILIIECGGQLLGVPSLSVEETLEITSSEIRTIEGREAISVREHIIPLTWLDVVLGKSRKKQKKKKQEQLSVVIIGSEDKRVAFVVDEFIDEQEVVIKGMGKKFQNIAAVTGVTVLGSGEIVLILDPFELLIGAREREIRTLIGEEEIGEKAGFPCILVADDQMTIRRLQRSILESAGYDVEEAKNGVEALEKIGKKKIDLVVSDVQMPKMDGFELTKKIKSKKETENIPVIIVSALDSEEDKKKGISLGADAYLTKGDFDQNDLVEVIKTLIGR